MRRGVFLALLVGTLALALAGAGVARKSHKHKTRTVKVGDDYFGPAKIKIKKGTKVRWRWLADNQDTHDVRLRKGPHGVKKFKSQLAASDYTYTRKFTKPGTYKIYCSLHKNMKLTIVVKR